MKQIIKALSVWSIVLVLGIFAICLILGVPENSEHLFWDKLWSCSVGAACGYAAWCIMRCNPELFDVNEIMSENI